MEIRTNTILGRIHAHLASGKHALTPWVIAFAIVGMTSWLIPVVGESDSFFYAAEIVNARENPERLESYRKLWEFGHLYWRPLGYFLYPVAMAVPDSIAWTNTGKILFVLTAVNHLALVVLVAGVLYLALHWKVSPWTAILFSVCALWMGGILGYLKTGMAYPTGLGLVMASILLQMGGLAFRTARHQWLMAAGGAAAGLASLIWFPYILVVPAALLAGAAMKQQFAWKPLAWRTGGFVTVFSCLLLAGAWFAGVRTVPEGVRWFSSSSHGWEQSNRFVRSVTGVVRLAVDLKDDGMQAKRYLLKDPYNQPSLQDLALSLGLKMAVFYLLMLAVLLLAIRGRSGRWGAALFAIAFLPVYLFAIFLFEPSSPERFVPIIPFLFAMIAMSWHAGSQRIDVALRRLILIVFCGMLILNFRNVLRDREMVMSAREMLGELAQVAAPGDVIVRLMVTDPMVAVVGTNPFLPEQRSAQIKATYLIRTAYTGVTQWQEDFARAVLRHWEAGNDVWLTTAMLADKPEAGLNWVEGDDPRVSWKDISSFLRSLETEPTQGGTGIVLKLSRGQANRDRFGELASSHR